VLLGEVNDYNTVLSSINAYGHFTDHECD